MAPEKILEKGAWPGSCDLVNFWVLNGNSCKMAKDTNFRFGMRAPTKSLKISAEKSSRKGGVAKVMFYY